jgi:hypothetical protein
VRESETGGCCKAVIRAIVIRAIVIRAIILVYRRFTNYSLQLSSSRPVVVVLGLSLGRSWPEQERFGNILSDGILTYLIVIIEAGQGEV